MDAMLSPSQFLRISSRRHRGRSEIRKIMFSNFFHTTVLPDVEALVSARNDDSKLKDCCVLNTIEFATYHPRSSKATIPSWRQALRCMYCKVGMGQREIHVHKYAATHWAIYSMPHEGMKCFHKKSA
jgi:hypothetical protein